MRSHILRQLARLAQTYAPLFGGRNLLITNTISSGLLLGTADVIQQSLEKWKNPKEKWNTERAFHMFVTGLSTGPLLHYWYLWIDTITPRKDDRLVKLVIIKVAIDQAFAPFYGAWYFIIMGLLQGHSLAESTNEFKDKFWDYFLAELTLWPAFQMFNFLFLPSQYRVLFVNIVTLGWNVYLSYLKHRS